MARVVVDTLAIEAAVERALIGELARYGREIRAHARAICPVRTGYARRSIYFAVLNRRDDIVAGDRADGNGEPIPLHQFRGEGVRLVVGANAPYFIWIEIGARGRPGKLIIAQAAGQIRDAMAALERKRIRVAL